MIKALLIDGDGVALLKQGYFSDVYAKEYGVPIEKILPFFKNEFRESQVGKADLKEVLPKYLIEWGWTKTVEDFLQYWFEQNTKADDVVIAKIQELRSQGVKCYLVTDQEKYRAAFTREHLGFKDKFDNCFFSCELGHSKSDPQFFGIVLERTAFPASEMLYLDDEEGDVESAKQAGIQAKLYTGLSDLHV